SRRQSRPSPRAAGRRAACRPGAALRHGPPEPPFAAASPHAVSSKEMEAAVQRGGLPRRSWNDHESTAWGCPPKYQRGSIYGSFFWVVTTLKALLNRGTNCGNREGIRC
uniref:Uncharacterized protein n=1 Tax=Triticum urartu TaxID=4572 RepID=A0A8R7PM55_TRIUA